MWSTPSMTTIVLAPAAVLPASLHIPRPLLQILFEQEDDLRTFQIMYPLRPDEHWQEGSLPALAGEMKYRFLLILLSPYMLVAREQARSLCWWEAFTGWRTWRYLTDEEL